MIRRTITLLAASLIVLSASLAAVPARASGPYSLDMQRPVFSQMAALPGTTADGSTTGSKLPSDSLARSQWRPEAGATATPVLPTATSTTSLPPKPIIARNPPLGSYYLALGDSFSYGLLIPEKPADPSCSSRVAPGFVCVFYRYLKKIKPSLKLNNLSESGADSCEFAGSGHRCFDSVARSNPVDRAIAFLTSNSGKVSPVTLTIGGNDELALLSRLITDQSGTLALLPGVIQRYRANLDIILGRLRAAAPRAEIIVTTQPDPLIGLGSPPLPTGLSNIDKNALTSLNDIMKQEAPKYGAIIADAYAAWNNYRGDKLQLDWLPAYLLQGRVEIHPTPLGYKVYGRAVIRASGFLATLRVRSRLNARKISAGQSVRVTGTTNPDVVLTLTLHGPAGPASVARTTASTSGSYSFVVSAGSQTGKVSSKVCARDNTGRKACGPTMSFTVS